MKLLKGRRKDPRCDHNNLSFLPRLLEFQRYLSHSQSQFYPITLSDAVIILPGLCTFLEWNNIIQRAFCSWSKFLVIFLGDSVVDQNSWWNMIRDSKRISNHISLASFFLKNKTFLKTTHLDVSRSSNSDFPRVLINFNLWTSVCIQETGLI